MKQISVFHKGFNTDLDYSKQDNLSLVLPTRNIQILNKEGQGLIITTSEGNKESFKVTEGFVIFGSCQYNGIAYLILFNGETQEAEIGSFPSPNPDTNVFEEVYRPLSNYNTGTTDNPILEALRTTLFDFDPNHPVGDQMFPRPDYDGSISLVFTDNKNELRFVNTGFDQDGKPNNRYYRPSTFVDSIRLIKHLPSQQQIDFLGESTGGQLRFGNYFFFFRYVTSGGDKSTYVAESYPVTVTRNSFENPDWKTSDDDKRSNKKVSLRLSALDSSYSFVEMAYMRFYADTEGVTINEIFYVDRLHGIPEGQEFIDVDVTGFETMVPLSITEILKPVNNETICKSLIDYDRMLWGANWTGKQINYQALSSYALKIKLGSDDSKTIPSNQLRTFYSIADNIRYAGYFRNEAYIFGVSFKLKNGYETERFPVRGIDARNIFPDEVVNSYDNNPSINKNGIIIMPNNAFSNTLDTSVSGMKPYGKVLAVVFDFKDAKTWLAQDGEDQEWLKENVAEVVLLRSRRKENMLYQGIAARVYGRYDLEYSGDEKYEKNDVSIPVLADFARTGPYEPGDYDGIPVVVYERDYMKTMSMFFGAIPYVEWVAFDGVTRRQTEEEKKLRAIFSPDFIFGKKEKLSGGDQPYVRALYKQAEVFKTSENHRPASYMAEFYFDKHLNQGDFKARNINVVYDLNNFIKPENPTAMRLVNKIQDIGVDPFEVPDISNALFWKIKKKVQTGTVFSDGFASSNRNMQTAPYFAIQANKESDFADGVYDTMTVVATYKEDPNGDDSYFYAMYADEINIPYSRVHNQNISFKEPQDIVVCYQGDAFIQLTTIKTRTWFPTKVEGSDTGYESKQEIGSSISMSGTHHRAKVNPGEVSNWAFIVPAVWITWTIGNAVNNWLNNIGEPKDVFDEIASRKYAHGELVDIVTENAINNALRFSTENTNRFYPALSSVYVTWGTNFYVVPEDFAFFPYTTTVIGWNMGFGTGIESFMVNHGNSATLSFKHYLAYNKDIPKGVERYPNRIRYSGQQEPGRPFLAIRMWDYNSKEDFDERSGPINKLMLIFGRVISIQHSSILMHYTNREEIVPSSSGEMVIGVRSILSKRPSVIALFGTQHSLSVVRGKGSAYGVDWLMGVIWRIAMDEEGNIIARSMDKEQMIERYVKDLKKSFDSSNSENTSNIVLGLRDDMFNPDHNKKEGVITGYNPYRTTALFTFVKEGVYETLSYSEDLSSFVTLHEYPAAYYFTIQNDMFSFESDGSNIAWIHGRGEPAVFYGKEYTPLFSFIVNGIIGEQSMAMYDKFFKAMEIEAPKTPVPVDKIEFKTLFQYTENNPFYNEEMFWMTPEYLISKWAFSINNTIDGQEGFDADSNIFGKWLKTTVYLNKRTETFVKNIMTIFTTVNT